MTKREKSAASAQPSLAAQWRILCRFQAESLQSMVVRVKTTVDIADAVLREAKLIAAREGTTLKALVEEGLRHVVDERAKQTNGFKLRDCSYGTGGGMPGIDINDWMSMKPFTRGAGS